MYAYVGLLFALVERATMQRLVKCCLRVTFSSADLELPAKGTQAPRAACGYGALVRRFTARRYSAAARDALISFANTDVSTTKMCLDTSILVKSNMDRREY
jgi:hypothetical protein